MLRHIRNLTGQSPCPLESDTPIIPASQNHVNKIQRKSRKFSSKSPQMGRGEILTQRAFFASIGKSKLIYAVSMGRPA